MCTDLPAIENPGVSVSTRNTLRPPRAPFFRIGHGDELDEVRFAGVLDEALVAVDDVVIALAHRARAHVRRVAAGVGLGLREGGGLLAAQHREEVLPALRLGQREQDRDHARPENAWAARRQRHGARHLLPHRREREEAQPLAAELAPAYRAATAPSRASSLPAAARTSGLRSGPSIACISIGISSRSTKRRSVSFSRRISSGSSRSKRDMPFEVLERAAPGKARGVRILAVEAVACGIDMDRFGVRPCGSFSRPLGK